LPRTSQAHCDDTPRRCTWTPPRKMLRSSIGTRQHTGQNRAGTVPQIRKCMSNSAVKQQHLSALPHSSAEQHPALCLSTQCVQCHGAIPQHSAATQLRAAASTRKVSEYHRGRPANTISQNGATKCHGALSQNVAQQHLCETPINSRGEGSTKALCLTPAKSINQCRNAIPCFAADSPVQPHSALFHITGKTHSTMPQSNAVHLCCAMPPPNITHVQHRHSARWESNPAQRIREASARLRSTFSWSCAE
jgi:hypothetical protein